MICRICGNSAGNKVYKAKEMMFGFRDEFDYFQCIQCECLQIQSFPLNLEKYYPKGYKSFNTILDQFKHEGNPIIKMLKTIRNDSIIFNEGIIGKLLSIFFSAPWLKSTVYEHFPGIQLKEEISKDTRIIDIGCGVGYLLYILRECGFKNLLGIDPFLQDNISYDNGLKILKKSIHDIQEKYDLVMFHHSFEHISDPQKTFQSISRILTKNGLCLIRIPIASSFAWEHYRECWVQLDAPRHLYLHSLKSIKLLSEKSNLKIQNIVYDSTDFQFWGSEQYQNDIPLTDKRSYSKNKELAIFSEKDIQSFRKKALELNASCRGDQVAFYLRVS